MQSEARLRRNNQSRSKQRLRVRIASRLCIAEQLEPRMMLAHVVGHEVNDHTHDETCNCPCCSGGAPQAEVGHNHDQNCTHNHGEEGHAHPLFAPGTPAEYVAKFQHASENDGGLAKFQLQTRFSSTASDGGGLALGDPTTITWSIIPDGTNINGYVGEQASPSDFVETFRGHYGITHNASDTNYQGEAWFEAIEASFDRWSELSGVAYVYEANDDGAAFVSSGGSAGVRGDVRIGGHRIDGNSGTLAYNFYPNTADMVIDTADSFYTNTGSNSLRLRNVIMHEAGHGLGIAHVESNNGDFLMEPFINLGFDGPQLDDILAAQRGYGDAYEDNETASTASPLGSIAPGSSVTIGTDGTNLGVSPSETDFVTIDDDGDIDYFSFIVGANSIADITLTPVGPTYNQGAQGGNQSSYNAGSQSDLTLQIIGSNGSTVLATANANGTGGSESVADLSLSSAGTYYARITGSANSIQLYQLTIGIESGDPTPGISVTQSGGSTNVTEGGATDTYSVVLDSQPTADVTVTVSPDGELSTNKSSLTFTSSNWDVAQVVNVSAVDDEDLENDHTGSVSHSASSSDGDYGGISIASVTANITDNESPPPSDDIYFSLQNGATIDGVAVQNEDIIAFDGEDFRVIFDGSDIGLGGTRIDAFDVISDTEILFSLDQPITGADDSDIIKFTGTYGPNTSGTLTLYFDGSDVGLTRNAEDIDAITALDDNSILISTRGSGGANGVSRFRDEDILRFKPNSLGSNTTGTFEMFVDGSSSTYQLADRSEDINGLGVDGSKLHLTTTGNYAVPGNSGRDDDIFVFDTGSDQYESEKALNLSSNDIWGIDFAGIADADDIGLGSGNSFTNPYIETDFVELTVSTRDVEFFAFRDIAYRSTSIELTQVTNNSPFNGTDFSFVNRYQTGRRDMSVEAEAIHDSAAEQSAQSWRDFAEQLDRFFADESGDSAWLRF